MRPNEPYLKRELVSQVDLSKGRLGSRTEMVKLCYMGNNYYYDHGIIDTLSEFFTQAMQAKVAEGRRRGDDFIMGAV